MHAITEATVATAVCRSQDTKEGVGEKIVKATRRDMEIPFTSDSCLSQDCRVRLVLHYALSTFSVLAKEKVGIMGVKSSAGGCFSGVSRS